MAELDPATPVPIDKEGGTVRTMQRMTDHATAWGHRIKARCDERGLTVPELALLLGVDRTTAYRWTHGQEPDHATKVRIARVLEVPTAQLFPFDLEEEAASA